MSKRKKILVSATLGILLYIVSTGASFGVFGILARGSDFMASPLADLTDPTDEENSGPRDTPCPLNGMMHTKGQSKKWNKRRPLAVMIENHLETRPQSGLSRADVIYEAVAEGGITRFMAVYLCRDAGDLAPVRSARTYYLDWLSEYNALYAHVGGANTPGPANALGQIRDYGIYDLDQFGLGFPTYWRGADRFAPHNVHSTTKKLWEAAEARDFGPEDEDGVRWDEDFVEWNFKDDSASETPKAQEVRVDFWSSYPDYSVTWKYDPLTNSYKRFHGDLTHMDNLTDEQLETKTIIVQFQSETSADDGYEDNVHLLYDTIGLGDALVFQDGEVIEAEWRKTEREAKSRFYDLEGEEIELNRGQIWIQTIPVGSEVVY